MSEARQWRWLLVGYATFFAGLAYVWTRPTLHNFWPYFVISAAVLPAIWLFGFFVVLIHELGHVLAALACRRRVRWIAVFGLILAESRHGWYLGTTRHHWGDHDRDGILGCVGVGFANATAKNELVNRACGPLANLAVCGGLYFGAYLQSWHASHLPLMWLMGANGLVGLASLLCIRVRNSDGQVLLWAARNPKDFENWIRHYRWNDVFVESNPADWDLEAYLLEMGEEVALGDISYLQFRQALDSADIEKAGSHLRMAWDATSNAESQLTWKSETLYSAAIFYAWFKPDPELAEVAWERATGEFPMGWFQGFAKVARMMAAGETEKARENATRLLVTMDQYHVTEGYYVQMDRLLAQILSWKPEPEIEQLPTEESGDGEQRP